MQNVTNEWPINIQSKNRRNHRTKNNNNNFGMARSSKSNCIKVDEDINLQNKTIEICLSKKHRKYKCCHKLTVPQGSVG